MSRVLEGIGASEALTLLQELVRTPSVNPPGNTEEAVSRLGAYLQSVGIDWRVVSAEGGRANLVATLKGTRPGKSLVLNGHIDVVPAGEGWTVDPFGAEVRDGRVFGRGADDMKGGLAAMAVALAALKRAGSPFGGQITFMAVADEESGGHYGTRLLLERGVGKGADFAIVGEPGRGMVGLGNRGVAFLEITIEGRAGHPGRPNPANPIHYAGRLITALANMQFAVRNELFEVPTPSVTVTMVNAGVKANVIPNVCRLTLDRRLLPGETAEDVVSGIEAVIAGVPQEGVSARVRLIQHSLAYAIGPEEPVARAIARAHKQVFGVDPEYQGKGGGTDGSHLYHMAGIPTVLYGPGDPRRGHTVDEWIGLDEVVNAARVYALAILDLLGEGN